MHFLLLILKGCFICTILNGYDFLRSPEPLGMQIVYGGTVYGDKETLPAVAFELLKNPDASRLDEHLRREVSIA